MGGGAMPEGGGGHGKKKKKALDAAINVVPAIDLLSCCISFLLFTAVWTQISKLQVGQSMGPADGPPPAEQKLNVNILMTDRALIVSTNNVPSEIPAQGRTPEGGPIYDLTQLKTRLEQLQKEFPDATAVTVAAEDTVIYNDLIKVIDLCVGSKFGNVSVTASGT